MYSNLASLLQRPALYERTNTLFWNDPYISTQMLIAHLDPSSDSASRKPEFIDRSVAWIASIVAKGSLILDIGCGPGLYASRLAARGYKVTGMDFSANSIAYAKEHDPDSEYILQNYLELESYAIYDAITLIWCDYGALIPTERKELLRRVYRALKPGGIFILDAFTPMFYDEIEENSTWELHPEGGFFSPKPHLTLEAEFYYGPKIGLGRIVVVEEDCVRCYNIWNTCFTVEDLLGEAAEVGLTPFSIHSDVTGRPFDEASTTLCAVLRK